jgi:hypothetical protein
MSERIRCVAAWIVLVAFAGCGSRSQQGPVSESEMEDIKLREVGELYRSYHEMTKKPPRKLSDFNQLGDAGARGAYSAIRSGEVVLRWQATLPDTDVEPSSPESNEVLAYWKTVPEQGGPVLMLDRRLRRMTAEEFKSARLAGTTEEKPAKSR